MSMEAEEQVDQIANEGESSSISPVRIIGWFSIGLGVAALGYIITRELRSRYKFNRRTPYDFYANGVETQNSEFPVGI
jgi:hypothetical protein